VTRAGPGAVRAIWRHRYSRGHPIRPVCTYLPNRRE